MSCCFATSVVRSRRGPCGLPSPRIFMVLGGMKAAFVLSPSPGLWRARRLDSADVDSRVWFPSTRTYIDFAIPFMVQIHSGARQAYLAPFLSISQSPYGFCTKKTWHKLFKGKKNPGVFWACKVCFWWCARFCHSWGLSWINKETATTKGSNLLEEKVFWFSNSTRIRILKEFFGGWGLSWKDNNNNNNNNSFFLSFLGFKDPTKSLD